MKHLSEGKAVDTSPGANQTRSVSGIQGPPSFWDSSPRLILLQADLEAALGLECPILLSLVLLQL